MDTGNYHYITYLLLDQIKEDFSLILFDHHPDMKPSAFGDLLSCGNWLKKALDQIPYLKEVILIGVSKELVDSIEDKYLERVVIYNEQLVADHYEWVEFAMSNIHYPIYISIDKDVIDEKEVETNWDQGHLALGQLEYAYHKLITKFKVIGVDVCGECADYMGQFRGENRKDINEINNMANYRILNMIEQIDSSMD